MRGVTAAAEQRGHPYCLRLLERPRIGGIGLLAAQLLVSVPAHAQVPFQEVVLDADATGDCKALGDLDGDGQPDVVLGGSELAWYRFPSWARSPIAAANAEFTTDMQVGDVDGDGDLDIVVPDGFTLHWFENPRPTGPPDVAPWARRTMGSVSDFMHDVEVGDLDRDGRLDVVTRKGVTDLWFQNPGGTWTRVRLPGANPGGEGTVLGDIDRDGDLDLALNGYWMRSPANPRTAADWTAHVVDAGGPSLVGVHLVDLNGDTRLDVAIAPSESDGALAWYEAPPDPTTGVWTRRVIDPAVDHIHTFKSADFDGDGDADLATAEMHIGADPDRVMLYRNGGGGLTWTPQVLATSGAHNIRVGDVGGDGDPDVVGANFIGSPQAGLKLWQNQLVVPVTLLEFRVE